MCGWHVTLCMCLDVTQPQTSSDAVLDLPSGLALSVSPPHALPGAGLPVLAEHLSHEAL